MGRLGWVQWLPGHHGIGSFYFSLPLPSWYRAYILMIHGGCWGSRHLSESWTRRKRNWEQIKRNTFQINISFLEKFLNSHRMTLAYILFSIRSCKEGRQSTLPSPLTSGFCQQKEGQERFGGRELAGSVRVLVTLQLAVEKWRVRSWRPLPANSGTRIVIQASNSVAFVFNPYASHGHVLGWKYKADFSQISGDA